MHMTKQNFKARPSQLHLLCFLYKEPNSIPKQLVLLNSSFKYSAACQKELCQVYKWQEIKTEKGRSKLGDSTQNIVLGVRMGEKLTVEMIEIEMIEIETDRNRN